MQSEPRSDAGTADDNRIDWTAVFNAQQRPLRRLAVRLVGEARADDVVQETFLRAYRARSSFVSGSAAYPWLSKITRRVAIDILRRDEMAARVEQQLPIDRPQPESVDDVVTNGIRRQAIKQALSALTERQRRLLVEVELGGHPSVSTTGSHAAAKSVLARARRNFRERYEAIAGENGVFAGSGASASILDRVRDAATRLRVFAEQADLVFAGVGIVSALIAASAAGSGAHAHSQTGGLRTATVESPTKGSARPDLDVESALDPDGPGLRASANIAPTPGRPVDTAGGIRAGGADVEWTAGSDGETARVGFDVYLEGMHITSAFEMQCHAHDRNEATCTAIGLTGPVVPDDQDVGRRVGGSGVDASAETP